jgi:hypothetical protein
MNGDVDNAFKVATAIRIEQLEQHLRDADLALQEAAKREAQALDLLAKEQQNSSQLWQRAAMADIAVTTLRARLSSLLH